MHVDGFMKIESETLKGQPSNEKRIGLVSCVCMVIKLIYWHINSNPNAPQPNDNPIEKIAILWGIIFMGMIWNIFVCN